MEFNLNAKRPWRFISALMAHGWRLEETTEINRGFFQLVKLVVGKPPRSLVVYDGADGRPVVLVIT